MDSSDFLPIHIWQKSVYNGVEQIQFKSYSWPSQKVFDHLGITI